MQDKSIPKLDIRRIQVNKKKKRRRNKPKPLTSSTVFTVRPFYTEIYNKRMMFKKMKRKGKIPARKKCLIKIENTFWKYSISKDYSSPKRTKNKSTALNIRTANIGDKRSLSKSVRRKSLRKSISERKRKRRVNVEIFIKN